MSNGENASERAESLVDELGDELADLDAQYRSARSAIADEDNQRRMQSEKIFESPADRNELVHQIMTLRNELQRVSDELSARDKHVVSLREQINELEMRVAHGADAGMRITDAEAELREERREAERLRSLLDARTIERDEISTVLRSLEVEKVQLRRTLESAGEERDGAVAERDELRKQMHRLEAQSARERREHEQISAQLDAHTDQREDHARELSEAKGRADSGGARVGELEALLERRDNEIRHLKKVAARNDTEMESHGHLIADLEARTQERDRLRRRLDAVESELTAQTTEAGASKKALELLAARTAERDHMEGRVRELEELLADANGPQDTGRTTSEELEARTQERNYLEQRVVELEARTAGLTQQNQEWREAADLAAVAIEERAVAIEARAVAIEARAVAVEEHAVAADDERAAADDERAAADDERAAAIEERAAAIEERAAAIEERAAAIEERDSLARQVKRLESEVVELEKRPVSKPEPVEAVETAPKAEEEPDESAPEKPRSETPELANAEPVIAEPESAEPDTAESDTAEPETAEPESAEPDTDSAALSDEIASMESGLQESFVRAADALAAPEYDRQVAIDAVNAAMEAAAQMRASLQNAAAHLFDEPPSAPAPQIAVAAPPRPAADYPAHYYQEHDYPDVEEAPLVDGAPPDVESATPKTGPQQRYIAPDAAPQTAPTPGPAAPAAPVAATAEPTVTPEPAAEPITEPTPVVPASPAAAVEAPAPAAPTAVPAMSVVVAQPDFLPLAADAAPSTDRAEWPGFEEVGPRPVPVKKPAPAPIVTREDLAGSKGNGGDLSPSKSSAAASFLAAISQPDPPIGSLWGGELELTLDGADAGGRADSIDSAATFQPDAEVVDIVPEPWDPEPRDEILALYSETLAGMESREQPVAPAPQGEKKKKRRRGMGGGRKRIKLPPDVGEDSAEAAQFLVGLPNAMIVVDGESVARRGWSAGPGLSPADHLVNGLAKLAERSDASFEVVFDGAQTEVTPTLVSRPRVRVRFVRGGVSLADVLVRLSDAFPSTQPVVVASSNADIGMALRKTKVNMLSASQLSDLIKS